MAACVFTGRIHFLNSKHENLVGGTINSIEEMQ